MAPKILFAVLLVATLLVPRLAVADAPPGLALAPPPAPAVAWGYVGETGPDHWPELAPEYAECAGVGTQSPVALSHSGAAPPASPALRPSLAIAPARFAAQRKASNPGAAKKKSTGFDVYSPPPPPVAGDTPPVDDFRPVVYPAVLTVPEVGDFELKAFHFHAPTSEHVVNCSHGAVELHFVFARRKGGPPAAAAPTDAPAARDARANASTAVVAVIFREAAETDPWLRTVLDVVMKESDGSDISTFPDAGPLVVLDLSEILPPLEDIDLYAYQGSLTTPPCTVGVQWFVIGQSAGVTRADAAMLAHDQGGPNARPLQELGSRQVVKFPRVVRDSA
jgi:carbonic anhydrase